jgi:hypothetical protein
VLVRPVGSAVQAVPFVVDIRLQRRKQRIPLASLGPAIESIEYRLAGSEAFRQVTPRHPGTSPPKHRLDEVAVVLAPPSGAALCLQNGRDLRPLPLVELRSDHRGPAIEHTGPAMDKFPAPPGTGTGTGTGTFTGAQFEDRP